MIRALLLRLLVVVLGGYIVYILYATMQNKVRTKIVEEKEKAEYDKEEWEKIKNDLEK